MTEVSPKNGFMHVVALPTVAKNLLTNISVQTHCNKCNIIICRAWFRLLENFQQKYPDNLELLIQVFRALFVFFPGGNPTLWYDYAYLCSTLAVTISSRDFSSYSIIFNECHTFSEPFAWSQTQRQTISLGKCKIYFLPRSVLQVIPCLWSPGFQSRTRQDTRVNWLLGPGLMLMILDNIVKDLEKYL